MTGTDNSQGGFGPHLMLDLSECDQNALESLDLCFDILSKFPEQIGMTKITQPHVFRYHGVVPEDWGITGMVIIAESHISIHTFPEKKYCFIDMFSCKPFDVKRATDFLIKAFGSKSPTINIVERGRDFPRSTIANVPLPNQGIF